MHINSLKERFTNKLEWHSVERIYLRQRSSNGSVNKTILKPRLALVARHQYVYVGFSRHKIPPSKLSSSGIQIMIRIGLKS